MKVNSFLKDIIDDDQVNGIKSGELNPCNEEIYAISRMFDWKIFYVIIDENVNFLSSTTYRCTNVQNEARFQCRDYHFTVKISALHVL